MARRRTTYEAMMHEREAGVGVREVADRHYLRDESPALPSGTPIVWISAKRQTLCNL